MENYRKHLLANGFSDTTVVSYSRRLKLFIIWMERQGIVNTQVTYPDIIAYVEHLQQRALNKQTIVNDLNAIRQYFECLKVKSNPATGITIKGIKRTLPSNLLSKEQLQLIYQSFDTVTDPMHLRDKCLLGLLVFQGILVGEIDDLTEDDLDLQSGTIWIRPQRTTNGRTLSLLPNQMVDLYRYTRELLPVMQSKRITPTNRLFLARSQNTQVKQVVHRMITRIREKNEFVTGWNQVRASVITNWTEHHNLRQVQYLCGHRHIKSTQRYMQSNLTEMHDDLHRFFPL